MTAGRVGGVCTWCSAEDATALDEDGDLQCERCEARWLAELARQPMPLDRKSYGGNGRVYLWHRGRKHTVAVWSMLTGISIKTIQSKLEAGRSVNVALTKVERRGGRRGSGSTEDPAGQAG